MRIYDYHQTTGYEILQTADGEAFAVLDRINGKPVSKRWKPVRVRRVRASARQGCRPSDAPFAYMSGVLVFRRSAVDALRDILDVHGELLPLEDEDGAELYAYNPRVLEALDYSQSEGHHSPRGELAVVTRHVFLPSVVEGVDIFRQKEDRRGSIYLSERFLQRWKKAKLKGLDFKLVWDSDLPPDQQPNPWKSKPVKMSTIK
jgi:hypothetical protein